jgi:hypothetical protein
MEKFSGLRLNTGGSASFSKVKGARKGLQYRSARAPLFQRRSEDIPVYGLTQKTTAFTSQHPDRT